MLSLKTEALKWRKALHDWVHQMQLGLLLVDLIQWVMVKLFCGNESRSRDNTESDYLRS